MKHHGFTRLYMAHPTPALEREDSADFGTTFSDTPIFDNAASLLEFVTKRWQQRWVTTDIWNEGVLEVFLRRPCFLLVSVDAPVSLRWKRLEGRWVAQSRFLPMADGPPDAKGKVKLRQRWRTL